MFPSKMSIPNGFEWINASFSLENMPFHAGEAIIAVPPCLGVKGGMQRTWPNLVGRLAFEKILL